eukprot:1137654-Pelagomonas_calceolata.AAC.1
MKHHSSSSLQVPCGSCPSTNTEQISCMHFGLPGSSDASLQMHPCEPYAGDPPARRLDLGLLPHKLNEHLFCAIDLDCDLRCLANSPVAFAASNKHRTPRTTNYCARYQKGTVLRTIVCMPDTHTPILGLVASQKVTVKNISQAVPRTPHVLAAHMLALTVIHCLWRTHICGASFVTYPHKDIVHM